MATSPDINQIPHVLTDRGSKYAVSGGAVKSRSDVDAFLKALKKNKRFAKATHNTWAVILSDSGPLKGDDGESGAGMVIVNMLEHDKITDHVIVVTRWYGGVKLGGDRFRRVKDSVTAYLAEFRSSL